MKKTSILFGLMALGLFATAQTRMSLYEEFTGENCGPCASTNPALNTLLAANASKVIPIKWQVPIPSAPSNTWSIYQQAKNFIDWRWKAAPSGFGYQCATCSPTAGGISYAPMGRMDGQELSAFGINQAANTNHPFYLTAAAISSAQTQSTPFSITFQTPIWDATFSTATVVATVTSSAIFNATGTLKFRLVLVERSVNFATPSGSNGEKDFYDPVRWCYNTTPAVPSTTISDFGVVLQSSWAAASTTVLTWTCTVPASVYDKGQMAFVGFIQDDVSNTNAKKVWQAARTTQPAIPNEAKATAISMSSVVCTSTAAPMVTVYNNGANAITSLTIMPTMNAVNGSPVVVTCNLAPATSTVIPMGVQSLVNGTNAFSFSITGVSGGDVVPSNNGMSTSFYNALSYAANPVTETFASFVPSGWAVFNPSNAKWPWTQSTAAGGYGLSSESTYLFINWTTPNNTHELMLPGASFTGTMYPSVKFDLAYAQLSSTGNDILQVQVSTNCGASWTTAWQNQGVTMMTAPPINSALFVPTASQWTTVTVPLYTYSNTANVLVRFHAIGGSSSNQGNAMYLDNINLFDQPTTGVAAKAASINAFDVYPNPASNDVNVAIQTSDATNVNVKVINNLGQVVIAKSASLNSGSNTINIDTKSLPSGVYYVSYDAGNGAVTKKLTITK
jgi:hypothetical protein